MRKPLCSEQSDLPSSCVTSERRLGSGVASVAGALGGNCKTLVVVTASPAAADTAETLQSLRFGEQCAKVRSQRNAHALGAVFLRCACLRSLL